MKQLCIMVVDELSEFVPFLRLFPEPHYRMAGPFQDEHDVVTAALVLCPDIVVMNIDMPRLNGIKAVRRLRMLVPYCRVVVKSLSAEPEHMAAAYAAGVSVYLINGISPSLRDAIRTVIDHSERVVEEKTVYSQEGLIHPLGEPAYRERLKDRLPAAQTSSTCD
ncbi:MAG: response regulator [Nitrospira sp.]|nr:response regulator [Nitrospira sp.]